MYSIPGSVTMRVDGMKLRTISPIGGRASTISKRKHSPTSATSEITNASRSRKPLFCRYRIASTSSVVIRMPMTSGMPNSRLIAIADPITSARSHAAIASSQITQRKNETGRE